MCPGMRGPLGIMPSYPMPRLAPGRTVMLRPTRDFTTRPAGLAGIAGGRNDHPVHLLGIEQGRFPKIVHVTNHRTHEMPCG